MRSWKLFLALFAVVATLFVAFVAPPTSDADAQVFFANTRIGAVDFDHAVVGTTAAKAIPDADVGANVLSWNICADQGNADHVSVSLNADPDLDGVHLQAGQCYSCPNCVASILKALNVKGGAASQGYSVTQYRQQ